MGSRLERFPSDIISEIVILLDLDDIRSLRLTSTTLAAKSAGHHFRSFFHTKHVELLEDSLQTFVQGIKAGGLCYLIQELVLIGIASDPESGEQDTEDTSVEREVQLLAEAFEHLGQNRKTVRLESISLAVLVATNTNRRAASKDVSSSYWRQVWRSTAVTFTTVFNALAVTDVQVGSLNIFNSPDLQQCSLASNQLDRVDWSDTTLSKLLQNLRSLSVSLSNRVPRRILEYEDSNDASSDEDGDAIQQQLLEMQHEQLQVELQANGESNFVGLAKLLSCSKELDTFELHYFLINEGLPPSGHIHHELLMQRVVEMDTLPRINRCRLRGIFATETDLLTFIQRTELRELCLENSFLVAGSFQSIFNHCTSQDSDIIRLKLDTLYEGRRMIHFFNPESARIVTASAIDKSRVVERHSSAVKKHLPYTIPDELPHGSPEMAEWRRSQRKEYGPI